MMLVCFRAASANHWGRNIGVPGGRRCTLRDAEAIRGEAGAQRTWI